METNLWDKDKMWAISSPAFAPGTICQGRERLQQLARESPQFSFLFLLQISWTLSYGHTRTLQWLNFRNLECLWSLFLSGDKYRVSRFVLQSFKGKKPKYFMLLKIHHFLTFHFWCNLVRPHVIWFDCNRVKNCIFYLPLLLKKLLHVWGKWERSCGREEKWGWARRAKFARFRVPHSAPQPSYAHLPPFHFCRLHERELLCSDQRLHD